MKDRTFTRWEAETPDAEFVMGAEAARLIGVSESTIRKWADDGTLCVAIFVGTSKARVFRRSDIEAIRLERNAKK